MKRLFYLLVLLMAPAQMFAQMLFSENLTMSLDSTKTLQGTIMPVLNFQNEKEKCLYPKEYSQYQPLDQA